MPSNGAAIVLDASSTAGSRSGGFASAIARNVSDRMATIAFRELVPSRRTKAVDRKAYGTGTPRSRGAASEGTEDAWSCAALSDMTGAGATASALEMCLMTPSPPLRFAISAAVAPFAAIPPLVSSTACGVCVCASESRDPATLVASVPPSATWSPLGRPSTRDVPFTAALVVTAGRAPFDAKNDVIDACRGSTLAGDLPFGARGEGGGFVFEDEAGAGGRTLCACASPFAASSTEGTTAAVASAGACGPAGGASKCILSARCTSPSAASSNEAASTPGGSRLDSIASASACPDNSFAGRLRSASSSPSCGVPFSSSSPRRRRLPRVAASVASFCPFFTPRPEPPLPRLGGPTRPSSVSRDTSPSTAADDAVTADEAVTQASR
eukprot:Opistho-1_new@24797